MTKIAFARFPASVDLTQKGRSTPAAIAALCAMRAQRPASYAVVSTAGDLAGRLGLNHRGLARQLRCWPTDSAVPVDIVTDGTCRPRSFTINDGDRWCKFPAWPILEGLLTPAEVVVLLGLCRRLQPYSPDAPVVVSHAALMADLGMGTRTLPNAIAGLEKSGVIDVRRRVVPATGLSATNEYRVRWREIVAKGATHDSSEAPDDRCKRGNTRQQQGQHTTAREGHTRQLERATHDSTILERPIKTSPKAPSYAQTRAAISDGGEDLETERRETAHRLLRKLGLSEPSPKQLTRIVKALNERDDVPLTALEHAVAHGLTNTPHAEIRSPVGFLAHRIRDADVPVSHTAQLHDAKDKIRRHIDALQARGDTNAAAELERELDDFEKEELDSLFGYSIAPPGERPIDKARERIIQIARDLSSVAGLERESDQRSDDTYAAAGLEHPIDERPSVAGFGYESDQRKGAA